MFAGLNDGDYKSTRLRDYKFFLKMQRRKDAEFFDSNVVM